MSEIPRNDADAQQQKIYDLAAALLDGTITAEEAQVLAELVDGNVEARRHYVRFMYDSAKLHRWSVATAVAATDGSGFRVQGSRTPIIAASHPSPPSLLHSAVSTLYGFTGSISFSYAIAAFTVAAAMLTAAAWPVAERRPSVAQAKPPSHAVGDVEPQGRSGRTVVAQITAMHNCRWPTPHPEVEAASKSRITLLSGLLEITYRSGAKVVLEGPATFQVTSADSGFLWNGKATVRLEGKVAGFKVRGSAPSTVATETFMLRAPYLELTNRGGEMGLWVTESGINHTHVFRGRADLRLSGWPVDRVLPLKENNWVWVEPAADHRRTIIHGAGDPVEVFARQVPAQPPVASDTSKPRSNDEVHFPDIQF